MTTEREQAATAGVEEAPRRAIDRIAGPASDVLELSAVLVRLADQLAQHVGTEQFQQELRSGNTMALRRMLKSAMIPGDVELDQAGTLCYTVRLGPVDARIEIAAMRRAVRDEAI